MPGPKRIRLTDTTEASSTPTSASSSSRIRKKIGRVNLAIDPDLKEWAQRYASERHTNLTNILIEHLVRLKDMERSDNVEQI